MSRLFCIFFAAENWQIFSIQLLYLFSKGSIASHPEPTHGLWWVLFHGKAIPVSPCVADNPCKLFDIFVARDAFDLLFGDEGISFILLIFGNNQNYLLDFRFQEQQSFLYLQFIAFEEELFCKGDQLIADNLAIFIKLADVDLGIDFGSEFFQGAIELGLEYFEFVVQLGEMTFSLVLYDCIYAFRLIFLFFLHV